MKRTMFVMSVMLLLAVGANASLITNGDFESGSDWKSESSQAPIGWTSSSFGSSGEYGETLAPLPGRTAALKSNGGNYYQQVFADAGVAGSYTVELGYGARAHSYYESQGMSVGDELNLRVSLWDVTADVELAGVDQVILYPGSTVGNFLTDGSYVLSYDNSGLAGHELALRLINNSFYEAGKEFNRTVMVDNVSAVVPEPATLALLGFGGLSLLKRKRK